MRVKLLLYVMVVMLSCAPLHGDSKSIFQILFGSDQKTPFTSVVEEKKDQLERLKEELVQVNQDFKEKGDLNQHRLDGVNQKIEEIEKTISQEKKHRSKEAKNIEFYNELMTVLTEQRRVLTATQLARKQIVALMEERIVLLQSYVKDPEFSATALDRHALYPMSVFVEKAHQASEARNDIKRLVEKQKEANSEIEKAKRDLDSAQKVYTDKKRKQDEFKSKVCDVDDSCFDVSQQGQLLDALTLVALYEQEFAALKLQVTQAQKGLVDSQLFFAQERDQVVQHNFALVKDALRVDEADIFQAQEQLEKVKRAATHEQNALFTKINTLTSQFEAARKDLDVALKDKDIPSGMLRELGDWEFQPKTVQEYTTYVSLCVQQARVVQLERLLDVYNAQIEREKAKVRQHEIHGALLRTWHTLKRREFKETEELGRETRRYKKLVAELERDIASYKEKRTLATGRISAQNKVLNTVRELRQKAEILGFLKDAPKLSEDFSRADELFKERIAHDSTLVDVYTQLISITQNALQDLKIIISELETKGIWQRSEYAISWNGIKNIIPDLRYFIVDTYYLGATFFSEFRLKDLGAYYLSLVNTPHGIILFFIYCLLLFGLFFALVPVLRAAQRFLVRVSSDHRVFSIIARIAAGFLAFVVEHWLSLYLWSFLFVLVTFGFVTTPFLNVLFYVGSIFYLIYYAYLFMRYFIAFNAAQDYVIFPQSFERRFSIVFLLLSSISVALLFFRQAFITATIHKSELPTILLAMYSILAIVFLLFSIGKEEVIALLPARGVFWTVVAKQVDRFYYPLLALLTFIMIVSDPYVGGYKNLVSYILWGLIYTGLLVWFLSVLHGYLRKASHVVFFYSEEDAPKDRFFYSRTWYGFFAILSFLVLFVVGIYVGFKIWGFPVSFERMYDWLNFRLIPIGHDRSGELVHMTPLKVLIVMGIIVGGFFLASLINRYVLGKIFMLLPVDLGVQNTVMSITRFLVVLVSILSAFLWADLGTFLIALGLVIGSIGYLVKEPIGDLVSYFIILVQRHIQIGDYVEFNDECGGVVRRITPRSVILRKKNSYTIIVPNSMFVTQTISNWSYARNYVAFDDILFTVPYKSDPELVSKLMKQVLEENVHILKSPAPIVRLDLFSDNGFVFMIRGFLTEKNILNKWDIASDIRFAISKKLREHDIHFALPTRAIIHERPRQERLNDDFA